jgi:formylglycine-generating enzyme required for sulfatase activity
MRRMGWFPLVVVAACAVGTPRAPGADLGASPAPLLRDPVTGAELVLVRGGCFQMGDRGGDGDEEETPVHEVCVGDFYLGRTEVTRREWRLVMGDDPSRDAGCTDRDRCTGAAGRASGTRAGTTSRASPGSP